ncbi:MAG: hypothetical protein ACJ71Q_11225, partial [Terriglobales bacterium]
MMRILRIAVVVSLIVALNAPAWPKSKKEPQPASVPPETRVYTRQQCLLSEPDRVARTRGLAGGLAGIFVPVLLEKGLGAISAALKKAGDEETLRDSGKYPTYFFRLFYDTTTQKPKLSVNANLGCILVVRGKFSAPDPDQAPPLAFPEPGVFTNSSEEGKRITRLNTNGIPVQEILVAYEAAINVSDDGLALDYKGRFLEVNGFQGGRSSDTRAMVLSL